MTLLTLTPSQARRLAVLRQRLAGPRPAPGPEGMLDVVRDLGCLQLDPINAVARSHRLVLFSRLGAYPPGDLDRLLWHDRSLFEYWAHVASIVLTEDYPIHHHLMRTYARGTPRTPRAERHRQWLRENRPLRRHILDELRACGPLPTRHFDDEAAVEWYSGAWTSGRSVTEMMDYLWTKGAVMVAGRAGLQKLWDVTHRCLPPSTPRERLPEREVVRRAAQRSLRALGVGRADHIRRHFTRGRYPGLAGALADLEAEGRIQRVVVRDGAIAQHWPGTWYVHADDLALVDRLDAAWAPRTVLLSPFDNLICDRARTERLFDFNFRIEIYVPPARRQYGYYVLPILHGDRLIGRIDPKFDRKDGRLKVNAVYAEPGAPMDAATGRAVAGAVAELAAFLGAREIAYDRTRVPAGWGLR